GRVATIDKHHVHCIVGRGSQCHLTLSDPSVRPAHCSLRLRPGSSRGGAPASLLDLSRSPATLVNGVLVREAFLTGDEILRIGDTVVSVSLVDAQAGANGPSAMGFGRLRGTSSAMRSLYPLFAKLALSREPVLIVGEPGVGKRLLAEELH